jgi:hypothetical protein
MGMGDVVNLRKVRKAAERRLHAQQSAANRIKYGRSKSERSLAAAREAKAHRDLDRHRIQTGDQQ